MSDPKEQARRRIEEWWAQGLTMREIAARLGWSVGYLSSEIDRMRRVGYSLTYCHHRD